MNEPSAISGRPARAPVFFWIAAGVLAISLLLAIAGVVLAVFEAKSINRSGGWGWLLVGAAYFVGIVAVCFVCVLCTVVSLFRRESHRPWSIAILIISGLVVLGCGPYVIRAANELRRQYAEERTSKRSSRPRAASAGTVAAGTDRTSMAPVNGVAENPQVLELKSRLWEAIRAKDVEAFVACFHIEERFNTPETRETNRKQVEMLLQNQIIDVEIRELGSREMSEIKKIQNAKPARQFRYSLDPGMKVTIRFEAVNGRVGRSFLIGEQNGQWYIVTMAGHTT